MDQMANTIVYIDSKGQCQTFFLNQHKAKNFKGKLFNLDLSYQTALSVSQPPTDSEQQSLSPQELPPSKQSFTMRAVQYFKGQSVKINLVKPIVNGNISAIARQRQNPLSPQLIEEGNRDQNFSLDQRRQEHQFLVTCLYNKVVLLHANPFIGQIFVYELDPEFVYKYQNQVNFPSYSLIQMQIIDNLLVIHNLDEKSS